MKLIVFTVFAIGITVMSFGQIKPNPPVVKPVLQNSKGNGGDQPVPASSPLLTDADYFLAVAKIMYLDFKKWRLYCKTDRYFNPLTPFITNRPMN